MDEEALDDALLVIHWHTEHELDLGEAYEQLFEMEDLGHDLETLLPELESRGHVQPIEVDGVHFHKTTADGIQRLASRGRIE